MLNMSHTKDLLIQALPSNLKKIECTLYFFYLNSRRIKEGHFIYIHTYCVLLMNICIIIHIAV